MSALRIAASLIAILLATSAVEFASSATQTDQTTVPAGIGITRKIRAELTSDAALSNYAKNVTIIVVGNRITLKGPVTSEAERIKIARIASDIAPESKIENKIQVTK